MDGCFVQNTMNTFSEARYYLNVNIMVMFDHHSSMIAAALGLAVHTTSKPIFSFEIQRNRRTLEPCRRRHDLPFTERTIGYK